MPVYTIVGARRYIRLQYLDKMTTLRTLCLWMDSRQYCRLWRRPEKSYNVRSILDFRVNSDGSWKVGERAQAQFLLACISSSSMGTLAVYFQERSWYKSSLLFLSLSHLNIAAIGFSDENSTCPRNAALLRWPRQYHKLYQCEKPIRLPPSCAIFPTYPSCQSQAKYIFLSKYEAGMATHDWWEPPPSWSLTNYQKWRIF
jgi:hypothetical protein